ncbi:MAG: hypothetical protein ACKOEC_04035 [Acidimicrobiia bacterium]
MDDKKPIAIIAAAIVDVVGGGIWWDSRPAPPPANTTPVAVNATEAPVDKPAPPVNLPPLDQMDAFLRPLLSALSSRPELVKWLATDDLIGQLATAIDQASEGDSPARDLKVIKPSGARSIQQAIAVTTPWCKRSRRSTPPQPRRCTRRFALD